MNDNCKYATPLYFYRVNRIFFGFRAFYPQIIKNFVLPLHRNSKSSHVHRTLIALPSHTRTRVTAMRRSSSAKRVPDGCRKKFCKILRNFVFNYEQDSQDYSRLFFILDNEKFCLILLNFVLYKKPKQVYLVLFFLFTPARFIPNPLVPAPRSYLSGGHGGN